MSKTTTQESTMSVTTTTQTTIRIVRGEARGFHSGRSAETIARRLFGRQAEVRPPADPNNPYALITRTDRFGTHVLAEFLWEVR